jgi:hypothetical protein
MLAPPSAIGEISIFLLFPAEKAIYFPRVLELFDRRCHGILWCSDCRQSVSRLHY